MAWLLDSMRVRFSIQICHENTQHLNKDYEITGDNRLEPLAATRTNCLERSAGFVSAPRNRSEEILLQHRRHFYIKESSSLSTPSHRQTSYRSFISRSLSPSGFSAITIERFSNLSVVSLSLSTLTRHHVVSTSR